ncbi:tail fiber domain-containing protein [Candidatus Sumerlaeota bacterium]|nr:tail fiber domain-containing protein [Candidatus Sumerlaeota bacterium]
MGEQSPGARKSVVSRRVSRFGGASYFAIEDSAGGTVPLKIEAGAPTDSIRIEDYGRVGLGTSTPYVELHIADGDSPTVRLDQDGSYGWRPQTWDVVGNETHFFILDATHGSKLCFRIEPNTPSNALCLRSTGNVGIGTWNADAALEVERADGTAQVLVQELNSTPEARTLLVLQNRGPVVTEYRDTDTGTTWTCRFGPDAFQVASAMGNALTLDSSGNLTIEGTLTESSNVALKENFQPVDGREVLERLSRVPVATWNFKSDDASVRHMGPTAQEFRESFGPGSDAEHIAPLDVNGVALAAIQQLHEDLKARESEIRTLKRANASLEARLKAIEESLGH